MTKRVAAMPRSLATKSRLAKLHAKELMGSRDTPTAQPCPTSWHYYWLLKEVERRRLLRTIALDHANIDESQPNWQEKYIWCLEELAFEGCKLPHLAKVGRKPLAQDLDPLFVVLRLELARGGDGSRLLLKNAALLLAREQSPEADSATVKKTAEYFIEVRKRYWRKRREQIANRSHRNGAN
jgi:hypothetical protein